MRALYWTPAALQDREAIYDYIEADNPWAALELDELLSRMANLLVEQPGLGRTGRVSKTREWVVHPHYVLVYDRAGSDIRILRVLHTSRQWPAAKS